MKLKRVVSFIVALAIMLSVMPAVSLPASAATSGTTGDCTWSLNGTTLTISGKGAMEDYTSTYNGLTTAPWGATVKRVVISSGVTEIGNYAFYGCAELISVTIPNTVTRIGNSAFNGCTALTAVTLPNSLKKIGNWAFQYTNLESITLPDGLTTIGTRAFSGCSKLTAIKIPGSVEEIGDSAFDYCTALSSLTIENGVKRIGMQAFSFTAVTQIVIPDSVYEIGQSIFYGCGALKSLTVPFIGNRKDMSNNSQKYPLGYFFGITGYTGATAVSQTYETSTSTTSTSYYIPDSLTTVTVTGGVIPYGAFYNCKKITTVTLLDGVTGINSYAFRYCTALKNVSLSPNIDYIGYSAFDGCSQLSYQTYGGAKYLGNAQNRYQVLVRASSTDIDSCTIHENTDYIMGYAFQNCTKLTSAVIPESVTKVDSGAFEGCSSLQTATILGDIPVIPASMFSRCGSLTGIVIPESVTAIGSNAFYECSTLGSANIPHQVEEIGAAAFYKCSSLRELEIPDGVKTIGGQAFYLCTGLQEMEIPDSVTTIGKEAFYKCTGLTRLTLSDRLKTIPEKAFYGCEKLVAVMGGNSVTKIATTAFYDCRSLQDICISDALTEIEYKAFYHCDSLQYNISGNGKYLGSEENPYMILAGVTATDITAFDFHKDVKIILTEAFKDCSALTELEIPDSVIYISQGALSGCSNLQSLTIPFVGEKNGGSNPIGHIFGTDYFDGVVRVGDYCFPKTLTNITVKGGPIGASAFSGYSTLTTITLKDGVTSIGKNAFYNCTGLTELTIPDSVTSITGGALAGCSSLQNLTIPFVGGSRKNSTDTYQYPLGYIFGTTQYTGGTSVQQYYYGSSTSSTTRSTYYIPSSLTSVTVTGGELLYGAFYNCKKLTDITVGESVEIIRKYAFYGCSALENLSLPDTICEIEYDALYGCSGLQYNLHGKGKYLGNTQNLYAVLVGVTATDITAFGFHKQTKVILYGAFKDCSALTAITVPESVNSIGSGAFSGCSSLQRIQIPFVGGSRKETGTQQRPLGYIFGTTSYTGCVSASQGSVSYYFPSSLTSVTVTGGTIAPYAFRYCTFLSEIVLGDKVDAIGQYAFDFCIALKKLEIPGSVKRIDSYAFKDCVQLTSVVIPDGVTYLGSYVFTDCDNLAEVDIPRSVTEFGYNIFQNCTALNYYTYNNGIYLGNAANRYMVLVSPASTNITQFQICEDTEVILPYAFDSCTAMTAVTLPEGLRVIGDYAFARCSALKSITIPECVEIIGSGAFSTCSSLSGMQLPQNITELRNSLFYNCTGLERVELPQGITKIGPYAFSGCSSLREIGIPGGVVEIGDFAFRNCTSLGSVVIPDSVTVLGKNAFEECSALTSVKIGNGLKEIDESTFRNCTGLKTVNIGNSVKLIDNYAFYNCSSLTHIEIPDSVTYIGVNILWGCGNLQSVTVPYVGKERKTAKETNQYPIGILFGAGSYSGGVSVRQYYHGSSTTNTTYSDFTIPAGLKTVTVNGGELLYGAFYDCAMLESVVIGADVTAVNRDAFIGCVGLERIEVAKDNLYYCSSNGILYNKDKTEIIWTPGNHQLLLRVNYLYASGETALSSVVEKKKAGDTYTVEIPEIVGYSAKMQPVTATMPAEDVVIDVIYYENPKVSSGNCSETISWTLYADGTLVLRGTGSMPDYTAGGAPWTTSAEQVKALYIDSRITSIGAYAFQNCTNLTFVDYGYSVATIGAYAFAGCVSLQSLKLPESVKEISEGAFSGCAGLTVVVIPDRTTAVGGSAFAGCTELVQVTIGAAVTAVEADAFASCDKLTQVYFRGKPAVLGSNALGSTAGKYVYYYTSVSGWDDEIANGLWNGYTAIPYNAISKKEFDGTNPYIIKVVDKHNIPLQNAVVQLGGEMKSTNKDGMAYFVKPVKAETLEISCSNHISFQDSAFLATDAQLMDVIELSDRPSTVQGVRVNGDSIATSVRVVNCASDESLQIAVRGYSKYKILRYELYQGSRLISTVTTNSENCTFSVKAAAFEEGETVIVKMHTSDGQAVASALSIDVVKLASISEQQILSEISQIDLSIGLGSMGSYKVPLTFAASGDEKFFVNIKGRTIRVGINLDIDAFKDKDEEKAKTALHKMVNDSMKNFAKGKPGLEYNLCGYIEIEYLGNGEYYVKTSYVKVGIAATLAFQAQASYFGVVGVYFKASITGESTLALKVSRFEPESGFGVDELTFAMANTVCLEGGAYLLWGIGSAGLYAKARMGFELGIIPDLAFKSVYITGEFGVRWSVLWGLYADSYVIAAGDIYRWPESQNYIARKLATSLYAAQQDPSAYEPNDRSYLENRSQWLGGDYLQKNIYDNVAPQIVTCGNTTMMLWLDDNENRDAANFQTLYYSVYTDGTWSKPVPVDDNGTFDCEFDVHTHNGKIYVVYTEMTTQNPSVATLDIADENAVTNFAGGVEVFVTVYENGAFTDAVQLTDNDACELLPRIAVADGTLTAAWVQTEMVAISGQTANNALYTAVLEQGEWSEPEACVEGQNTVSNVAVVSLEDGSYTACIVDADGSGETKDDQSLLLGDAQGNMVTLDTGFVANVSSAEIAGQKVLTWHNNGKIYMIARSEQEPVCLLPEAVTAGMNYQLVTISEKETLLTFLMSHYDSEGNVSRGTDLYGIYVSSSGYVTQPVRITETEGYVANYTAAYDGALNVVFTETFANVSGEDVETVTHLRSTEMEFHTDISLESVDHDPTTAKENTEYALTLQLQNRGMLPVDGVVVRFCDAAGGVLYTAQCDVRLLSGAVGTCEAVIVLPAELNAASYSVQVLPGNATDADLTDNSQLLDVAYVDFAVAAEQKIIGEKNYVSLAVSNIGNVPASAMLAVYASDVNGRMLSQLDTGTVAPGVTQQYFVELSVLLGEGEDQISCVAVSQEDPYQLNNTDTVVLLSIDDSVFTKDPEQVIKNPEISVIAVDYDKYSPADITVDITAEAAYFTAVEGLTKGNEYTLTGNRITFKSAFVSGMEVGTHDLQLVFDFGYDTPVVRTLTVTVTDSTPVKLSGSIAISGDVMVGSSVYADVSGLQPAGAKLTYQWEVNGSTVSNLPSYEIKVQDLGKTLKLTVCGTNGFAGEYSVQETVAARKQNAPATPVINRVESFSFAVAKTEGVEYSIDLVNWQDGNVFENLAPNTVYTVYARRKATETAAASPASVGAEVTTRKAAVEAPAAPQVVAVGDTTVQLLKLDGVEYSMDRISWQSSNIFGGLQPNCSYAFYARFAETESSYASPVSAATVVTTQKSPVAAPAAPEIAGIGDTTVRLVRVDGMEYSMDQVNWQAGGLFGGLQPNREYAFYARVAETETTFASSVSAATIVTTKKSEVAAPAAPEILTIGDTSVALVKQSGIEYSMDGESWAADGLFGGLQPNREYTFYARVAETETTYASLASAATLVTTKKSEAAAPAVPNVELRSDTTVTLQLQEGYEYSMDGIAWQNAENAPWYGHNRFVGLSPNTEYTFYQRTAETDTCYASPASAPLVIRTWKSTVAAPQKPVVDAVLADSIILQANENYQYKLVPDSGIYETYVPVNGNTWGTAEEPAVETAGWQDSNVFTGLQPNTRYVCYQRYKGTDTAYASYRSDPTYVTTVKYTPEAAQDPTVAFITDCEIVLTGVSGMQYSMDGIVWQESVVFSGLQPNTTYTIYARWRETETTYASAPSSGIRVTTDKAAAEIPAAPLLEQCTIDSVTLQWMEGYEYSLDCSVWQDAAVFTGLLPDTEYTFYQRTKETDTHYASPASVGLTVRTEKKTVVIAVDSGEKIEYPTLSDAIMYSSARTTLQLLADVTEDIAIRQDMFLDLNGFTLTGNITVTNGASLSVMDSQTDDFTIVDENGYGKIIGQIQGVKALRGYLMITEAEGVSFHRIDLDINAMTLRASEAGVYYKSNFAGDEIVAQNVVRYGISFSVTGIPSEEDLGICSWFEDFLAGADGNAVNGTLLHGVMKKTNSAEVNDANADMPVYGRAYIQTKDGRCVMGNMVSRSFREQVELADECWDELTGEQKAEVLKLYETYREVMDGWDLSNIPAAAK